MDATHLERLELQALDLELHIEELDDSIQPLLQEKRELLTALEEVHRTIDTIKIARMEATNDIDWHWLISTGEDSVEKLNCLQNKLEPYSLRTAGTYNPETNQRNLMLMIERSDTTEQLEKLEKMLQFLTKNVIIPHTIEVDGDDDYEEQEVITFQIFEHTLSEGGIYQLVYNVDPDVDVWSIQKTVYHRTGVQFVTKHLMIALEYIQKNHYYE